LVFFVLYNQHMKRIIFIGSIFILAALVLFLVSNSDYYEYEAQSSAECAPGEEFDAEYGVCYFDFYCETEEECAVVDKKYGQVLDSLALEYEQTEHDHHEKNTSTEQVLDTASSDVQSQTEKITHIMNTIVPARDMKRISKIFPDSDGPDGTLAYVEPSSENGSTWKMAYDPTDSFNSDDTLKNPQELLTTLVHEYAHVLALNDSQVDFVSSEVEFVVCEENEVILDEGCGKSGAYLSQFVKDFWPESVREQTREAMQEEREEEFSYELYDANPDNYLTKYAATNETEDFAESFALFVMRSDKPEGKLVKNQKLLFFYSYPELVTLRSHMRGGLLRILETQ